MNYSFVRSFEFNFSSIDLDSFNCYIHDKIFFNEYVAIKGESDAASGNAVPSYTKAS